MIAAAPERTAVVPPGESALRLSGGCFPNECKLHISVPPACCSVAWKASRSWQPLNKMTNCFVYWYGGSGRKKERRAEKKHSSLKVRNSASAVVLLKKFPLIYFLLHASFCNVNSQGKHISSLGLSSFIHCISKWVFYSVGSGLLGLAPVINFFLFVGGGWRSGNSCNIETN